MHVWGLFDFRRLDLVAEFDRVILFKGNELNSSVVHGSDQRWTKDVLIGELRREIRLAEQRITSAKVSKITPEDQAYSFEAGEG